MKKKLARLMLACIFGLAVVVGAYLRHVMPNRIRFYALARTAGHFLKRGEYDKAEMYARELLTLAGKFEDDWNYGNALHKGNLILGRLALRSEKIEDAKTHLIRAGETPGSPQLNTFGPNMTLAKELLELGQRETVLEYFDHCSQFWKMDYAKDALRYWRHIVQSGEIPDFGANLWY